MRAQVLGCAFVAAIVWITAASADPPVAPSVTTQPDIAVVGSSGDTASFAAAASGTPAPTVQWQMANDRNGPWSDISGATGTTLTLTASSSDLGHAYRAVFTNSGGTAITRPAKLVSKENWMRDLGSDIANVPLTELTIPGSHDMGTFAISGDGTQARDRLATICTYVPDAVCDSYARAQDNRNALEQLDDGIRYFDLRVCGSNDPLPSTPFPPDFVAISENPVTCHGLVAASVGQILFQVASWAGDHPNEVVILDFNHLYQVDPGTLANQVKQAFAVPGGGSLLYQPRYCTPGDPDSGTCAGDLTLGTIWQQTGHGNVIVNFENDGAPGDTDCLALVHCYNIQRTLGLGFYDSHPEVWGRSTGLINFTYCTRGGAATSCFGNTTDRFTALSRAVGAIDTRQTFAEPSPPGPPYRFEHFFVQFLQTTPDGKYMVENPTGSLLDMAMDSNPVVGPGVLGCGDWGIYDCFAQYRPENLNILALNFYNRTVEAGGQPFDFVREVVKFDEYARTSPVVRIASPTQPAPSGWYNASVLGGQGEKLDVDAVGQDYRYPTGVPALDCSDGGVAVASSIVSNVQSTDSSRSESLALGDGVHAVDCSATDGASKGLHGVGNSGAGPGSTAPVTFNVDTTPPTIRCPDGGLLLNQPVSSLTASVTDATSGPATSSVSTPISTASVGSFTATLTAADVAGNTASALCSYTVSYRIALRYDPTKQWNSGSTVPVKVELDDYYGKDVSDKSVVVTARTVTTPSSATIAPSSAGGTNPGFVFYVSPSKGYQYDLKTTGYAGGAYTLDFVAGRDPLAYHAPFLIR